MMKEVVDHWVTVEFGAGGGTVIQPEEQWLDAEGYDTIAGLSQVPVHSTNLTAYLETAEKREGPWETVHSSTHETAPEADTDYTIHWVFGRGTDVPQTLRVNRYVRYKLVATGAAYICCRRVMVLKKKSG